MTTQTHDTATEATEPVDSAPRIPHVGAQLVAGNERWNALFTTPWPGTVAVPLEHIAAWKQELANWDAECAAMVNAAISKGWADLPARVRARLLEASLSTDPDPDPPMWAPVASAAETAGGLPPAKEAAMGRFEAAHHGPDGNDPAADGDDLGDGDRGADEDGGADE